MTQFTSNLDYLEETALDVLGETGTVTYGAERELARAVLDLVTDVRDLQNSVDNLRFELDTLDRMRVNDNGYLIERAEKAEVALAEVKKKIHNHMRSGGEPGDKFPYDTLRRAVSIIDTVLEQESS